MLHAAIEAPLRSMGVVHVEIVARGTPNAGKYWVGYRLAPGMQRSQRELTEQVKLSFPGTLSCQLLSVVPVERLPETDPGVIEEQRRLRRPTFGMVVFFGMLALVPLGFVGYMLFGMRGDLIVTAPLKGAGTAEARFVATGGDLALWASLEGSGSGSPGSKALRKILPVRYDIEVIHDGKLLHTLSVETQRRRPNQRLICTMAPNCEVYLEDLPKLPPGPVLLRVKGTPAPVFTSVKDMSLLVRKGTF
ncbi:MAG: hypothetical protein L6Q84_03015 [Polyangiaceae bacterium]|nr:hypothetical protein [Polyangiaceae bacterium]